MEVIIKSNSRIHVDALDAKAKILLFHRHGILFMISGPEMEEFLSNLVAAQLLVDNEASDDSSPTLDYRSALLLATEEIARRTYT